MKILLDTCTFLWASQQPAMLSQVAIAVIDDSRSELHVSDVSLWEITLKHAAGKLPLPDAPRVWIPQKLAYHQFQSLRLNQDAIFRSGELPGKHPDPFDRLIAAQSIEFGLTILSPDTLLSSLGAARIWEREEARGQAICENRLEAWPQHSETTARNEQSADNLRDNQGAF